MAQYKIDFASLKGTKYQVQIFDTTTFDSDSATPLTPGAEPFTTEEDDNESPDCWVRQCTGYLRFIDEDGTTAKTLCTATPYSMHVNLYDKTHQKRVFCGFLKSEQYDQPLFGYHEEIEIPVVSHLTRWYDKYMSNDIEGIMSVGEILAAVMQGAYDYALIPDNALMKTDHKLITDDYARQYMFGNECLYYLPSYNTPKATQLGFWVDNFKKAIDRVAPTDHAMWGDGPYEPCTYGDVLDSICALLGWQICEDNDMIICRDINQQASTKYQKISRTALLNDGAYSAFVNDDATTTNDLDYCSDDHNYETIAPYSQVSVKSEARAQSKTYIDISDKKNITLNGVFGGNTDDAFAYQVPKNSAALTQYKTGGSGYGLLSHPSWAGGELVAYIARDGGDKGKCILLQDSGGSTVHNGLTITANEPTLLVPTIDSRDNRPTKLMAEGQMRCNNTDGQVSEGSDYTGWLTMNVNAGGCGMVGAKNYTRSEMSEECNFFINYDACSQLSSYTEVLDRNTPLYTVEVVRASVYFQTAASYKHVMIDGFKLSHSTGQNNDLYALETDYGDIGSTEVLIPQSDDNKLEITTKLGLVYTDGTLFMHYTLPIAVSNSARATTRYARFKDFPTKVIGNNLSVEDCLQRVFNNVKTTKIRHKLTVHVRDDVRYYTRITHDSKVYLPVSRKWNWREDECELTILSIPELS